MWNIQVSSSYLVRYFKLQASSSITRINLLTFTSSSMPLDFTSTINQHPTCSNLASYGWRMFFIIRLLNNSYPSVFVLKHMSDELFSLHVVKFAHLNTKIEIHLLNFNCIVITHQKKLVKPGICQRSTALIIEKGIRFSNRREYYWPSTFVGNVMLGKCQKWHILYTTT